MRHYEYRFNDGWTLSSGNGLRVEQRRQYRNEQGERIERETISGPDGTIVSAIEKRYHEFAWGRQLVAEISDPDGDRRTTTTSYYEQSGQAGYGLVKSRRFPDGSWLRYRYDRQGRIIATERPWLDGDKASLVINDYTPLPADGNAPADRLRPRTVTEMIGTTVVAKRFYHYAVNSAGQRIETTERCTTADCSFGDASNLRSVATYYPPTGGVQAGKLQSQLDESGLLTTYRYESGTFNANVDPAKARFEPGKGRALRTTIGSGAVDYESTRQTVIADWLGRELMREQFVKTPDGFARYGWSYNTYDNNGRLIETLHSNHTRTENSWSCCGQATSTDAGGITTSNSYDELGRLTASTNEATGTVVENHYDAAGRQLRTVRRNGELSETSTFAYDLSGRVLSSTDVSGLETRYRYQERTNIVMGPGGEQITRRFRDGNIRTQTGTGLVDRFYHYGVNPDGSQWTTVFLAQDNGPRWQKTTRDFLGRIVRIEKPGFAGVQVTTNAYDRRGRLIATESTGTPATLYQYDAQNNLLRSGQDLDGNQRLELGGADRINGCKSGGNQGVSK